MHIATSRRRFGLERGFTLLELIITIGILASLTVAMTSLLRSSFDVRFALAKRSQNTNRIGAAMFQIAEDIRHTYSLATTASNAEYFIANGLQLGMMITTRQNEDRIMFTVANHLPRQRDAQESNLAKVVYELRDSKTVQGRKNLFRGETPRLPEQLDADIDERMRLFLPEVKRIKFHAWNGTDWEQNGWNSVRNQGRIPRMIKIELEAYEVDPRRPEGESVSDQDTTVSLVSIVYLPYSHGMKELKEPTKQVDWDRL